MGDDSAYWAWRDEVMAHPDGRATGGEPCVQCGAPVPRNGHWKQRDRHVCSARCNKNLGRKFSRMLDGAAPPEGMIRTEQPPPRPNPRTRPVPAQFGMLDDEFGFDFDGYGPMPGDAVTRYGSTTVYLLVDPEFAQALAAGGLGAWADGPLLFAHHNPTDTGMVVAADPVDLTPTRVHLGTLIRQPDGQVSLHRPLHWDTVVTGADGRPYRWVTEDIRHALPDDSEYTWHALVCQPAEEPFGQRLWTPAYVERSDRLRRISATVAAHARRVRKEAGQVERFASREVFERDGWLCGLCHLPIDPGLKWPDPQSASLDHILSLAAGGEHTRANTQAAHLRCNVRKGARTDLDVVAEM
jgi:5-methylcytosine-specific restriction endonuclease McrA